MDGWIKLHRSLLHSTVWKKATPVQKNILIVFLLRAASDDFSWALKSDSIVLKPGQLFIRLKSFAEEQNVSLQSLRTTLQFLAAEDFIIFSGTKQGTLVSIKHWLEYQNANTPFNTPFNTPNNTPCNVVKQEPVKVCEDIEKNTNTPFNTPINTPFNTHNKNIYNKNNNNKNKTAAEQAPALKMALQKYQSAFGCVSPVVMQDLQEISAETALRAVEELLNVKAELASRHEFIKAPAKYLQKILLSWRASGLEKPWEKPAVPAKTDAGSASSSLLDFYRRQGVEI